MATTVVQLTGKGSNPKTALYVGGLEENVNEATLHAAFLPFGDIKDVSVPLDHATGKHRGFGFVEFEDKDDAAAAIDNMHNAELYGRVLRVNYAQPMKIKGGDKGWASQAVWADADDWFERQQAEQELERLEDDQRKKREAAALQQQVAAATGGGGGGAAAPAAEGGDPMAAAEAEALAAAEQGS